MKAACDLTPISEFDDRIDEAIRIEMYCMLVWMAYQSKVKLGWAAYCYKDMFGSFPPWQWRDLNPIPATAAVEKWVASREARRRREYKRDKKSGATLPGSDEKASGENGRAGTASAVEGRSNSEDLAIGHGDEPNW